MAYVKTVWSTGDTITATLANNWEKQYDDAMADIVAAANTWAADQTFNGLVKATKGFGLVNQSTADFNTLRGTGFYGVNSATNAPPSVEGQNAGPWHYVLAFEHDAANWSGQLAMEYNTGNLFVRAQNNGPWNAWSKIMSEALQVQDVFKPKAAVLPVDTRTTNLTYTSGNLTQVTEVDGATTVKTTTLTYTGSQLSSVQVVAGGTTVTSTLNYNADGTLASVTKAVQ